MLYIVSGLMRSGTSMMMGCLGRGGIPLAYSPERDARFEKYADIHYHPNPGGFFELEQEEITRKDFTTKYDNHAVKIVLGKLLELPPCEKKVIIMTRHDEEVKQSYGAFFGDEAEKSIPNLFGVAKIAHKEAIEKIGPENVITVSYRDVIDNPIKCLTKIKEIGFPINVEEAAKNVDPSQCRFKHENLEVLI